MSNLSPHSSGERTEPSPVAPGTRVVLDPDATFLDRNFLAGGTPWRLLRLPGSSLEVARRWMGGDVVRPGEEQFARTLIRQGLLHPIYEHESTLDDVDVVIPVRNNVTSLTSLLVELEGLHVTVVDDGSVKPVLVRECVAQFGAELVRLERNVGAGGARNAGASATQRPFLCFIDDDVSFSNPRHVLSRLRAQFTDHELGACAPRVRGGEGSSARERFEQRFGPLDMGARSGLVVPNGSVSYVPTACLMVRRDAFGVGFDEELRFGEDVDFVWRLTDHDWLVRYVADVEVMHRARPNWRRWIQQRAQYGSSSSELAVRHGDRLAPLRADPWTLVAWASLLARNPTIAMRITKVARDALQERLSDQADDPRTLANDVISRTMVRSGAPLSRALVRTYGPLLLLAALHPRLRRPLLGIFAVGTAWRWRHQQLRLQDIPLALADDAAYGIGVFLGAWRSRSLTALRPKIMKSSITLRDVVGLAKGGGTSQ